MSRLIAFFWMALVTAGFGQLDSDLSPRELKRSVGGELPFEDSAPIPVKEGADHSPVLVAKLITIRLSYPEGFFPMRFLTTVGMNTVEILGFEPPAPNELVTLMEPAFNKPLTEEGLDHLTDLIIAHFQEHDRPVIEIVVPEQDRSDGSVTIEITEGRVGVVGMEKTDYFNSELIGKGIHLEEGELLTASGLQEQIDWLNRNPFRSASVYAAPGAGVAEADFMFTLEERRPWRGYFGYENSGTEDAGEHRFFGGGNWGDAFHQDHLLGYQFTMGESLDQFQAHSVSYEIPLHRSHRFVRFNGTWADVEAETVEQGDPLLASGETWLASVAYGIPFGRWKGMTQEVMIGVEYKSTDNFLNFGGMGLPGSRVELVQARVDYRASKRWEDDALTVESALVLSPGGLAGGNEDEDFEAFRAGATADYFYAKAKATWLRRLAEGWSVRVEGEGQWANGPLLAIEQLAFGGHDTVRGYSERVFQADSGYLLSTELRAPAWEVPLGTEARAKLQLLGFIDHGAGWLDGGESESFTGAGAGVRLQALDRAEMRLDVAWPLDGGAGTEVHAGLLLSF